MGLAIGGGGGGGGLNLIKSHSTTTTTSPPTATKLGGGSAANAINTIEMNMLDIILNEIEACVDSKEAADRLKQLVSQMHVYFSDKLSDLLVAKNKLASEFEEYKMMSQNENDQMRYQIKLISIQNELNKEQQQQQQQQHIYLTNNQKKLQTPMQQQLQNSTVQQSSSAATHHTSHHPSHHHLITPPPPPPSKLKHKVLCV